MKRVATLVVVLLGLITPALASAQDRNTLVRNDRAEVSARGDWIYNDLSQAREEAEKTGKPLLAVIRCIP